MDKFYNINQLLRVEIKSKALLKRGQKGFVTYFRGGSDERIIGDCKALYPQFMKYKDKPYVNITTITQAEYDLDAKTKRVNERQIEMVREENIMKPEDYENEVMENQSKCT